MIPLPALPGEKEWGPLYGDKLFGIMCVVGIRSKAIFGNPFLGSSLILIIFIFCFLFSFTPDLLSFLIYLMLLFIHIHSGPFGKRSTPPANWPWDKPSALVWAPYFNFTHLLHCLSHWTQNNRNDCTPGGCTIEHRLHQHRQLTHSLGSLHISASYFSKHLEASNKWCNMSYW